MTDIERHNKITKEIHELYKIKNAKYGNSFADSIDEFGFAAAGFQIGHKFNRVKQMIKDGDLFGTGEEGSFRDNLRDVANYCMITMIELDKQMENQ